ncbi:MAG: hypothetical protein IK131_06345 [Paludibacteraceae bacterium]|nr:hypothetical protein [Paludibacteraceae bacterium]
MCAKLFIPPSPDDINDQVVTPLTFTAEEDGSSFGIRNEGWNNPHIQYSLDEGNTWTNMPYDTIIHLEHKGGKALLRGYNLNGFSENEQRYTSFIIQSGAIAASGNVMSLIHGERGSRKIPSRFCFYRLFYACENLTQAPELPATLLRSNCYEEMFCKCTNLKEAPQLPAFFLDENCYARMFQGCANLTETPKLLTPHVSENCYEEMFMDCSKISKITVNFTKWVKQVSIHVTFKYKERDDEFFYQFTQGWLSGVAPNGTFICPKGLPKEFGESRIPEGWTIIKN